MKKITEWNGEDLPPVGEKVIAQNLDMNNQHYVEVIHYHEGYVWLKDMKGFDNYVWVADDVIFKLIKSERDKEIENMVKALHKAELDVDSYEDIAEHLYNQGLRFVG